MRLLMNGIDGVVDATVEAPAEQPTLRIEVDIDRARRFGVKPGDVRRAEAILLQGILVGSTFKEQKVFDVIVQGDPKLATSQAAVRNLLIDTPDGGHVRLSQVADIRVGQHADASSSARACRASSTSWPTSTGAAPRDVKDEVRAAAGGSAAAARVPRAGPRPDARRGDQPGPARRLRARRADRDLPAHAGRAAQLAPGGARVPQPAGRARRRRARRAAARRLDHARRARSGCWRCSAWPPATRSCCCATSSASSRSTARSSTRTSCARGAQERLAPVLASAAALGAAMLPFVFMGSTAGLEIVHPMAVVLLCGLATSTALTLFVLPALYLRFETGRPRPVLETPATDAHDATTPSAGVRVRRRAVRRDHGAMSADARRRLHRSGRHAAAALAALAAGGLAGGLHRGQVGRQGALQPGEDHPGQGRTGGPRVRHAHAGGRRPHRPRDGPGRAAPPAARRSRTRRCCTRRTAARSSTRTRAR